MGMGELNEIGNKFKTDKASWAHGYLDIYESYLKDFKDKNIALIELGVGGYEFADRGGESLKMWHEYFTQAKIIGIDIHNKQNIINYRTEFWQGSQNDKNLLSTIIKRNEEKQLRVVIDDASHNNKLTIESFNIIFPFLKSGDLYFIEDVQTSYFDNEEYEGNKELTCGNTTIGFFSELIHQLNHEHLLYPQQNYFSGKVEFIHFYKEIIVVKKL